MIFLWPRVVLLRPQHLLFSVFKSPNFNSSAFLILSLLFCSSHPAVFSCFPTCFLVLFHFISSKRLTSFLQLKSKDNTPQERDQTFPWRCIHHDPSLSATQPSFASACYQANSATPAIMMKIMIVMVRAVEYYSRACSSYLDQNESQGGEVPPSHSNFVVRY